MDGNTKLIPTHKAAEILGKHRWTVWHWWKTGVLEAAAVIETAGKEQPMFDLTYITRKAEELRKEAVA